MEGADLKFGFLIQLNNDGCLCLYFRANTVWRGLSNLTNHWSIYMKKMDGTPLRNQTDKCIVNSCVLLIDEHERYLFIFYDVLLNLAI